MTIDVLLEFLEYLIHGILYYRKIYPSSIFERKFIYGISSPFCLQNDIKIYIQRVLSNAKPLLENRALNSLIVGTYEKDSINARSSSSNEKKIVDQIVIKCEILRGMLFHSKHSIEHLEVNLRDVLLQTLLTVDTDMAKCRPDGTWALMVSMNNPTGAGQYNLQSSLNKALSSNEWRVDDEQHPDYIARLKSCDRGDATGGDATSPYVTIKLKSFENEYVKLAISANCHY